MKKRIEIQANDLNINIFKLYSDWMLLTAGEWGNFNSMTIAWGSMGLMWKYPVIMVGVRPTRYTYDFIDQYNSFTVCVFGKDYKEALTILGTKSGRDTDKIKESGLTPCKSNRVDAPCYKEAKLVFECSSIYQDDLEKANSTKPVKDFYKESEYHRFYIGAIKGIYGVSSYLKNIE